MSFDHDPPAEAVLVRQLVTESLVLFLIGGAGGVLMATWGTSLLSSIRLPVPIPLELDFRMDTLVLAFGLALALCTGILFGLAPALQSTKPALTAALKNDGRHAGSTGRMRRAFVMAQIGLSLLLLLSAGLFLRSLQRAAAIDTGFDPADVRMVSLELAMDGDDDERGREFTRTLLERVRELPRVTAASVAVDLPMDFGSHGSVAFPEGFESTQPEGGLFIGYNVARGTSRRSVSPCALAARSMGQIATVANRSRSSAAPSRSMCGQARKRWE